MVRMIRDAIGRQENGNQAMPSTMIDLKVAI
jgi:hypothetical protein